MCRIALIFTSFFNTMSKLIILACLLAVSQSRVLDDISIKYVNQIQLGSRIIGGHDARPGEFPHQVSLQLGIEGKNASFEHFCGGSILSEKYILTTAHCMDILEFFGKNLINSSKIIFVVKAGKNDLKRKETSEQVSEVEKYVKHEKWDPELYDIAVLKLKTPLRLNKSVNKVRLPKKNSNPTGDSVISGWGANKYETKDYQYPTILQTLKAPLITRDACDKAIEEVTGEDGEAVKNATHRTQVCTGPLQGGASACNGDSGGPLILMAKNGQPEIVGLASWTLKPCGRKGAPSVYAKVSYFVDWIERAMKV